MCKAEKITVLDGGRRADSFVVTLFEKKLFGEGFHTGFGKNTGLTPV